MKRICYRMLLMALLLFPVVGNSLAEESQPPVDQDPALVITTAELERLLIPGAREGIVLVDARPEVKYQQGHIPGAISIPKPQLSANFARLPRDKTLIFYCGGLSCPLSGQSAVIAKQNGYEKVRAYYEGMPGWSAAGHYAQVELPYLAKLVTGGGADPFLLVDARPRVKYQQGFIPGAVSIPKAEFAKLKGLLPVAKELPIIIYCGGYSCDLSSQTAELMIGLGYTNVSVFSAGEPVWREAGLPVWGDGASGGLAKMAAKPAGGLPEAITPEEFQKLLTDGQVQVIDVREPKDYAVAHIKGAVNIFEEDFIFKAKETTPKLAPTGRVVLVCNTGSRSASAYYAILNESDYPNKHNLQYLDKTVSYNPDGTFAVK